MQKVLVANVLILTLMLACSVPVYSIGPQVWELSSFHDFQQGKVTGCSIAHEGRLTLSSELKPIFSTDQVLVWSLVKDSRGNLYLGTGHSGKVFKVDSKNDGRLFYTAKELDVFALAVDPGNNLYVGTSPDGKVFKVTPEGNASEFFDPHSKYIWALAFDPQGNLLVGTGDQGKIYKVDPLGKGSVFYDTNQTHVMALRFDGKSNLLAGTFPEGILFRISPAGRGFVLYDTPLQEIHSIEIATDGSVYIGCLNEKMLRRPGSGAVPQPALPVETGATGGITVTVTDSPNQAATEAHLEPQFAPSVFTPGGSGGLRSAIYRIAPDLAVETLWSSTQESVFDLLYRKDHLLFSTDTKGRLYEISLDRKYTLLAEANEAQATRLVQRGQDLLVATSNSGKLYEFGSNATSLGAAESPVKDTQFVSKWGIISWQGEAPPGSTIQFFTRSGNSDRPDSTWSDWSSAYARSEGEQITSPSARFIQWKAELKGNGKASPWIDSVAVAYLPQNIRPEITSLTITPQGLSSARRPGSESTLSGGSSEGDSKGLSSSGESQASVNVTAYPSPMPSRNRVTINWQADDKNHDTLEYAVYIRGTREANWKLLKKELRETSYTIDSDTLPDGKYRARIVVSDAPSNPPGSALTSEMESDVFQIDNTPPKVEVAGKEAEGDKATVHFRATDAASNLRRAEFSLDGGKWQMIESDDGIVDSGFEEFTVQVNDLSPGEHVVTLRVFNSSGNVGLAKAIVNITKK
jgi:WD40 repeat protein